MTSPWLGVREGIEQLGERPRGTLTAIAGIAIGTASLVGSVGLAHSASEAIETNLDELSPTEVLVEPNDVIARNWPFPLDVEQRLRGLSTVVGAGTMVDVEDPGPIRAAGLPNVTDRVDLPVIGASVGLLSVSEAITGTGRSYDTYHDQNSRRVVLLGAQAAQVLNITDLTEPVMIAIGIHRFTVTGILGETGRLPELRTAVIVPLETAKDDFALSLQRPRLIVATERGASVAVARQSPFLIDPVHPERFAATTAPSPTRTRVRVLGNLRAMLIGTGVVGLVVATGAMISIMLLSVMERVGEIGLRRALGASRRDIRLLFLIASAAMGLLGGVVGASVGVIGLVVLASTNAWAPVLPPILPWAGVGAGIVLGLAAGTYPAARAARLEPVEALQHGM